MRKEMLLINFYRLYDRQFTQRTSQKANKISVETLKRDPRLVHARDERACVNANE